MEPCIHAPAERPLHALAEAGLPEYVVRGRPGLIVGEVAGRDSVAALVQLARERVAAHPDPRHTQLSILPTAVATGTEYGDWSGPAHAVHVLRDQLAGHARIFDLVRLTSPTLWAALNGRWGAELAIRYGAWSPCMACHLYVHLCRVPLAWALGAKVVTTGERNSHAGQISLSQTPATIAASEEVFAYAGLELLQPVQTVDDEDTIAELVGSEWPPAARQLDCLLAGNFVLLDGELAYDAAAHERYLKEFFVPAGRAVIDAWREGHLVDRPDAPIPDYGHIIRDVVSTAP